MNELNQASAAERALAKECPNCWGWQEYHLKSDKSRFLSLNRTEKLTFILHFVKTFINGTNKRKIYK